MAENDVRLQGRREVKICERPSNYSSKHIKTNIYIIIYLPGPNVLNIFYEISRGFCSVMENKNLSRSQPKKRC